jgi:hypothetical protein
MNRSTLPRVGGGRTFILGCLGALALTAAADAVRAANTCPRFQPHSQGLPMEGEWRTHPALADVDGDGRLDVAGHLRKGHGPGVFLQNGKGGWKSASTGLRTPGFSCGVGVDLADLNADGHLDLAVADHCQGLFLYLGDGKGTWRLSSSVVRGAEQGFDDVQVGDLDGDGHADLVVGGAFRGGVIAFRGDGTGKFKEWPESESGLPTAGYASDVELVDMNGDGRLDVAAAYGGGIVNPPPAPLHRNAIWLSEPSGRYRPATPGLFPEGRHFGISIGDVDGDGRKDFVVSRDRGQPLQVYRSGADGGWHLASEGLPEPGTARFWGVALADLNGDGHLDLVASDHPKAGTRVWIGDGTRWTECPETGLPAERADRRGWGVAVGNVSGDGRPDLVLGFGRDQLGSLEVWVQKP